MKRTCVFFEKERAVSYHNICSKLVVSLKEILYFLILKMV